MSDEQEQDISEVVDELPEDLDRSFSSPYEFPNNDRRRIPAVMYMVIGTASVILWLVRGDGVLVNTGLAVGGGLLVAFGLYQFFAGVSLEIDENEALLAAMQHLDFAVGHASGQLSWRGLLSRPTWRMLLYSTEEPPTYRALVRIDGVTGEVVDALVEDNPEDLAHSE
ncbi:MAG: hypothetical protein ACC652_00975 [Acidimicrobiales bacterium]